MLRRLIPGRHPTVLISLLIAFTSVLGAAAAWRTAVASGQASGAERAAFDQVVAREQARAAVADRLENGFRSYLLAKQDQALAVSLGDAATRAAPGDAARLLAEAQAWATVSRSLMDGIDPDLRTPTGSINLERGFQINLAQAEREQDLDPAPEFALADAARHRSEQLVGLTALMIAAAFFLTLARVLRTRTYLVFFGAGIGTLAVTLVLFLVWGI